MQAWLGRSKERIVDVAALKHLSNSLTFLGNDGYLINSYYQFTFLWMIKRQRWIRGPDLPSKFYLKDT